MTKSNLFSLAIIVGVVGVGLYLLTRQGTSSGGSAYLPSGGTDANDSGPAYITAGGEAIGNVLSGIGGLIGNLGGAGGKATGASSK